MKIETMTKDEKSCLLYIETCCVDGGGLMEGARMNGADLDAIKKFKDTGILVRGGRIPSRLLSNGKNYFAELSDAGWALAGELRRWRARPEARGPHAAAVFAEIDARAAEGGEA